jgi:hypothetical protein
MRAVVLGLVLALIAGIPASAADPVSEIDAAATATGVAHRSFIGTDLLSVSQSSTISPTKIALTKQAAAAVGAAATEISGYSIGMAWVRRNGATVQQYPAPGLWQYPMSTTVVPLDAMPSLMGHEVAKAVSAGGVAMGHTTAALRGAQAGDTIGLVGAAGNVVELTIGVVAPDASVGGAEIVLSRQQATALGADDVTSVIVYGVFSRTQLEAELAARGLVDGTDVRIRRSWDLPNPDAIMGMLRTKLRLGEFAYQLTDSGTGVAIAAEWVSDHLPTDREQFADIPIRARCHKAIRDDIQAALTEIAHAGLAWAIDLGNTNTYGGCYNPRFNRLTGGLGFLSRHAWAQALDMNTTTNAQGRVPRMNCDVVRIFRKHGFAWGGNFLTPDGMHFEWVGERRDLLSYPSEYCPNVIAGVTQPRVVDQRATFFDVPSDVLLSLH